MSNTTRRNPSFLAKSSQHQSSLTNLTASHPEIECKAQQLKDQEILEKIYSQEIKAFNYQWDLQISEFKSMVINKQREIETRHELELEAETRKAEEDMPTNLKYSREYYAHNLGRWGRV